MASEKINCVRKTWPLMDKFSQETMTNPTCYIKEEAFQSNNVTKRQISLPQALGLAFTLCLRWHKSDENVRFPRKEKYCELHGKFVYSYDANFKLRIGIDDNTPKATKVYLWRWSSSTAYFFSTSADLERRWDSTSELIRSVTISGSRPFNTPVHSNIGIF